MKVVARVLSRPRLSEVHSLTKGSWPQGRSVEAYLVMMQIFFSLGYSPLVVEQCLFDLTLGRLSWPASGLTWSWEMGSRRIS